MADLLKHENRNSSLTHAADFTVEYHSPRGAHISLTTLFIVEH